MTIEEIKQRGDFVPEAGAEGAYASILTRAVAVALKRNTFAYADSGPLGVSDPLGLSPSLTWGEALAEGGRGAATGASRGSRMGLAGIMIGGAAGAAYGVCRAAANSDPCAYCYEDDKRNVAQCAALAATSGRRGSKAYWRTYHACLERMNKLLYECLEECEAK
jgi:hypothetical protein